MEKSTSKTGQIELIKKFQETGDEKLFNRFYADNKGLVLYAVAKFRNLYERDFSLFEKDDFIITASTCLFHAMKTYDFSNKVNFSTYYFELCRHEFLHNHIFTKRHEFPVLSLDMKLLNANNLCLKDVIENKEFEKGFCEVENEVDTQILLKDLKKILTKREFEVIFELMTTHKNKTAIAKQFQVSHQTVAQACRIIRTKLKTDEKFRARFKQIIGDEGMEVDRLLNVKLRNSKKEKTDDLSR